MPVKITIIGLGKIGASAGLALARHTDQLHRVGHDIYPEIARRAQREGAVDKVAYNLPGSVADADIVFLALPIDQIRDTLKHITHDLKEGAVVMDTAPVKTAVTEWAKELLLPNRYYVGLTPIINPKYLLMEETGTNAAREDMFSNGLMGIVTPQGTVAAALKLATDLTSLLGAKPLYFDIVEVDSLMAATHLVPQLLAAGLIGATSNQPGWDSGRKVAGAAYAQVSSSLGAIDTPGSIAQATELSKVHVLRILDNVIRMLVDIKGTVEDEGPEALKAKLEKIQAARLDWIERRYSGDWDEGPPQAEMPTPGDEMRRWVLGKRRERDQ